MTFGPILAWRRMPLLGSIPSPSSGDLGPFHMYGVILAVGVLAAVWVSERRWRNRGYPRDGIYDIAFWVVVWGVIGARLYHVVTDYQLFTDDPLRAFEIWRGGLGIWGAVLGGGIAVVVITKRRHLDTLAVMDCMAPGIILAQAIGRWGNYFNQELFGKPTTLPWALEIAPAHRPLDYARLRDVPTHVSLRVAVLPRGVRHPPRGRAPLAAQARADLRVVRDALHVRPLLVREHAHRPRAPRRGAPHQRVGVDRRVPRRLRVVPLVGTTRVGTATPC